MAISTRLQSQASTRASQHWSPQKRGHAEMPSSQYKKCLSWTQSKGAKQLGGNISYNLPCLSTVKQESPHDQVISVKQHTLLLLLLLLRRRRHRICVRAACQHLRKRSIGTRCGCGCDVCSSPGPTDSQSPHVRAEMHPTGSPQAGSTFPISLHVGLGNLRSSTCTPESSFACILPPTPELETDSYPATQARLARVSGSSNAVVLLLWQCHRCQALQQCHPVMAVLRGSASWARPVLLQLCRRRVLTDSAFPALLQCFFD